MENKKSNILFNSKHQKEITAEHNLSLKNKHFPNQYFTVKKSDLELLIKHLSVFYNNSESISDISFAVPKNNVIAIIGKSGCGKSTLLRCINRLNDFQLGCLVKGKIFFRETNINNPKINTSALRSKIGMVFQKPTPFSMSIFDNVAYGPRIHGIKNKNKLEEIVIHALKRSGLYEEVKDNLNQSALSLSGGQQQRICIARAIALEPEILLFDEPTSALDPIATESIEELILTLKKKYTIIIVTHSLQQTKRIADYVMFLNKGKMIEYDTKKNIFNNPKNPKLKKYIYYSRKDQF